MSLFLLLIFDKKIISRYYIKNTKFINFLRCNMKMEDLWEFYGRSWADVVRECGISWGSIRNWRIKGVIPWKYQQKFEKITKGVLKADIHKSDRANLTINTLTGVDVERARGTDTKCNKS
jgi:hypothetical protein